MKYLIWANFKMNKTSSQIEEYLKVFKEKYSCFLNIDLMIAPSMPGLWIAWNLLKDSCVKLGSQNMHFEECWAYTWEVSAKMIKELWCEYVILWHSERREYFCETNEIINKKIISALNYWIRPILCIWENLKQKEKWITKEVLKIQIVEWLNNIDDFWKIDIAYEPIWSIWTWKIPTKDNIEEIHNFIRDIIKNKNSRIIYWGSVNPENSKEIIKLNNIDWFLVWGASLKPSDFLKIAQI